MKIRPGCAAVVSIGTALLLLSGNRCTQAAEIKIVSGSKVLIDFGLGWGAPATQTELTTQLKEFGVVFSSGSSGYRIGYRYEDGPVWFGTESDFGSFSYCISPGFKDDGYGSTEPIRVDFEPFVSEVSVRGYDGGGDIDTMVLTAYGSDDTVIGSASVTDDFSFPGNELAWVGGDIAYATFHVEGSISGLFYDDLGYTFVPEPRTAILLLIGALACTARRQGR